MTEPITYRDLSEYIHVSVLERMCIIACDTKKDVSYDKSNGTWAWFDKSERENIDAYHTGFKTFIEALKDATEPYMNTQKENNH